ncbi:Adenosylhomocysteinase OS=Streptomyces glaucescens OX=1907 GN=ahcY PE=3 SV=1 [Streptomyces glaucescens]
MGKGCAESLRGQGARVIITEIDPIALQAAMDGYQVTTLDEVVETADIFTTTGNKDIIMGGDMAKMEHQAIIGNIGHFDNEIDMAGLAKIPGHREGRGQAAGPHLDVPRRQGDHRPLRGPPAEPGQRRGPPSFVMSNSFADQTLAQIELFAKTQRVPDRRLRAAQAPRREGRPPTWTRSA